MWRSSLAIGGPSIAALTAFGDAPWYGRVGVVLAACLAYGFCAYLNYRLVVRAFDRVDHRELPSVLAAMNGRYANAAVGNKSTPISHD
jgi:hypothetical protein